MADRRDLSIPVNLGFLAVLVVTSAFVAATPPDQTVDMAPAELPAQPAPLSEAAPVAPPSASTPLRLTAVSMPPIPDRLDADSGGQLPDPDPLPAPEVPGPVLSEATPATPTPAIKKIVMPPPPQPVAHLKPMAPSQITPAQITPVQTKPVQITPVQPPHLAPLIPSRHRQADPAPPVLVAMSAASSFLPAEMSQAAAAAAEPLRDTPPNFPADQTPEGMPDLQPMKAGAMTSMLASVSDSAAAETAPQAADWQAADRLMGTAAQRLSLEFLWPANRQSHARIYAHLTTCLGVETGIIDAANRVHMGSGGGKSFNAALHSPFMRIVDRPVDPREGRDIERIRARQQVGSDGVRAVRVFRRSYDMWLLAALNRAFGGLPANGRVTAEYELDGDSLYLGKLTLDGRPHKGRISLDRDRCA